MGGIKSGKRVVQNTRMQSTQPVFNLRYKTANLSLHGEHVQRRYFRGLCLTVLCRRGILSTSLWSINPQNVTLNQVHVLHRRAHASAGTGSAYSLAHLAVPYGGQQDACIMSSPH